MKTYREIIALAAEKIQKGTLSSIPFREGEILIEYITGMSRENLYMKMEDIFPPEYFDLYMEQVERRASKVPLAYITGTKEFMSLEFYVNPSVLIPRPETEILAESIIEKVREKKLREPLILDIGTGSGAIAITLAKYIPSSIIYATDISEKALNVAVENALKHNVSREITFLSGDLFEPLEDYKNFFDVIVSNPPYVSEDDKEKLSPELSFEPPEALYSKKDPLFFYKKIIPLSAYYLKGPGILAFEIGFGHADKVRFLFEKERFENILVKKDLAGIDRVIMGERRQQDGE